jgi:hypothetical protein
MNFITTHIKNFNNIINENNKDLKETVIILKDTYAKKIIFHFPLNRFSDYEEKYNKYLIKINGTKVLEEGKEYILTTESDYNIYMEFYLTFY